MPLFCVDDPIELLALSRLVRDAKFQPECRDRDLWASPYVHALAARIDEAMLASYQGEHRERHIKNHLEWRASLPQNSQVLAAIRARLKEDAQTPWWREQSAESKLAYVRGCVAPYQPEDAFLRDLIHEAER